MKLFTTSDIRSIDKETIESTGISSLELVKRAARGITDEITKRWSPRYPMVIFAGPGNNGADGLATAINLIAAGYHPSIYLFNIGGSMLGKNCKTLKEEIKSLGPGIDFIEVTGQFTLPELSERHVVIDSLFGTGLREELTGGFKALVRYINESGATIVSIDIPSGMSGDLTCSNINRNIVHANLTIAIEFPRISFFLKNNSELVGEWVTVKIGLSQEAIAKTPSNFHYVEGNEIKRLLRERSPFSSKADYGSCLIIGGSYGMMGAAVLSTKGALRSGAGKVTVHAPQCGYEILQSSVPEALFDADAHKLIVSDMMLKHRFNSIAIGPGLGTNEQTINALDNFLKTMKNPVVLDADALNCISRRKSLLTNKDIPVLSILTPHAIEFDRLFGEQPDEESRLLHAMEMSKQYEILIILKGHYTALVRPDSKVFFNSTGNAGMATGGSGDVLTGVIASLMAQGYKPEVSALIGTYIHGLAGDLASEEHGEYGMTASDIAANIGKAFKLTMTNKQNNIK
ncbi:MAG: NAD(P)H-hydrate dehydratase [Paramuribaculum sp.]|nr:NAD(P)H-hydrate dehydratase [Paramuribaculum sp.]